MIPYAQKSAGRGCETSLCKQRQPLRLITHMHLLVSQIIMYLLLLEPYDPRWLTGFEDGGSPLCVFATHMLYDMHVCSAVQTAQNRVVRRCLRTLCPALCATLCQPAGQACCWNTSWIRELNEIFCDVIFYEYIFLVPACVIWGSCKSAL